MRLSQLWIALAAMAALGLGPAPQEENQEARGFMAAKGRVSFRSYCASCHGAGAEGNGNLAAYLKQAPADLTRIAERRGGEFPHDEVTEIIDGRRSLKGHGSREMPVWGDVFQSPLAETASGVDEEPEERAARKVKELVLFLESIQAEG